MLSLVFGAGGALWGAVLGVGPIDTLVATGNRGLITAVNGIPVTELVLGITSFAEPPVSPSRPAPNADNFDLNLLASGDEQPHIDTTFGQAVTTVFLIESGGNDRGRVQALDAAGEPVGEGLTFDTGSYGETGYLTELGQVAFGLAVWADTPIFGLRITPLPDETLGFDAVSVSAFAAETGATGGDLHALPGYSEVWNGEDLAWNKALYTDVDLAGESRVGLPFGVALPDGYVAGNGERYPLVVYLHGAAARGINDNANLIRQTARSFAYLARVVPDYEAIVLSPQVPTGQVWVGLDFAQGPYEQSSATLTVATHLTENLIRYVLDPAHDTVVMAALGFVAGDVDTARLYLVGDSMGAYGSLDIAGRATVRPAAVLAAAGSGPSNRLAQLLSTPIWMIHGIIDETVPNFLPWVEDPDGAGSLGLLALLDPSFDNTGSSTLVRLDDYASDSDDPTPDDRLVYTQYPEQFDHQAVATNWSASLVSDFASWLFGQSLGSEPPQLVLAQDPDRGDWFVIWQEEGWVLQESVEVGGGWVDVFPPAVSPHPVSLQGQSRFFRVRSASD